MDKDGSLTISFNEWRDFLLYAPSTDLLGLIEYWHHTNVSIDLHWKSLCIISLLFFYSFLIQVISIVNIISIELFYICRNIDCSSNANNSETVYYLPNCTMNSTRTRVCCVCARAHTHMGKWSCRIRPLIRRQRRLDRRCDVRLSFKMTLVVFQLLLPRFSDFILSRMRRSIGPSFFLFSFSFFLAHAL